MRGFGLSDIEEKWRAEKSEEGITDLPDGFYEKVASYVSELRREIGESDELRRELLEREVENVLEISYEIHFLRIIKITDRLVGEQDAELMESERIAFERIRKEIRNLSKERFESIIEGRSELEPPREVSNVLVTLTSGIPERIIGADMNYYGPFESGDFANLPSKSAEMFVDQGIAKKVKIREE